MKDMEEARAAVAVVHARGPEEDSVLLIRRAVREDDPWSGHWSLPGGRRDPDDPDLVHTALRELEEECGVQLPRERLHAALPPQHARRKIGRFLLVAPFVFRVEAPLATTLDEREAVESLWLPLREFSDPGRHSVRCLPGVPAEMMFPCVVLPGIPLWGFTYRLLGEWLGLIESNTSPEQAGFAAASELLAFLLGRGLTLVRTWEDHSAQGMGMSALVRGRVPVDAVRELLHTPGARIPHVSMVEVAEDRVRVVGWNLEEYLIQAAPDAST